MSPRVIKAKPNPYGKDTVPIDVPSEQLAGEWVDIKNDNLNSVSLSNLSVYHRAFKPGCRDPNWGRVIALWGELETGKVLRVHSGGEIGLHRLKPEDREGADIHFSTGNWYVWNNDCGDTVGLWNRATESWVDMVSYDPDPPEGRILRRVGNKLVP